MKKEVENWWKHAQKDLEKAEVLYDSKHFDGAAFFCQQSVEAECRKRIEGFADKDNSKLPEDP